MTSVPTAGSGSARGPVPGGRPSGRGKVDVMDATDPAHLREVGGVADAARTLDGSKVVAAVNADLAAFLLRENDPKSDVSHTVQLGVPTAALTAPEAVMTPGHADLAMLLVPERNVVATLEAKAAAGAHDGSVSTSWTGVALTDTVLPLDVALHETAHLNQVRHMDPALGRQREQEDAAHTAASIERTAVREGMADAVAMSVTRDWRMGEDYFAGGAAAVRDIAVDRATDQVTGAVTDYRAIDAALHQGDGHAAGTVIPRTFHELQSGAGWAATERLARAVGDDATLWSGTIGFAGVVDSMRRNAAAIDPSGALGRQVEVALAATHLGDAVPQRGS